MPDPPNVPTRPPPSSPPRPSHAGNLEFLLKQAKALLRAYRADEPSAVLRMAGVIPRLRGLTLPHKRRDQNVRLADAQHVVARELGYRNWPALARDLKSTPILKGNQK